MKILVVDDDAFMREIVGEYAVRAGFEVATEGAGWEALESAAREPYFAIVSDIKMNGGSGVWLLQQLTAKTATDQFEARRIAAGARKLGPVRSCGMFCAK